MTKFICFLSALVLVNGKNISNHESSEVDAANNVEEQSESDEADSEEDNKIQLSKFKDDRNCWMSLDSKQHFDAMAKMEERYKKVRHTYQVQVGEELDRKMLKAMLEVRGIAEREIQKTKGVVQLIPAGLNLGGYCMMRMKDSVLFFHRIKLRNDTRFRVNFLENNLVDMTLTVRLSLHDLHLVGAYERSPTDKEPSILFYAPSYGEVEPLPTGHCGYHWGRPMFSSGLVVADDDV